MLKLENARIELRDLHPILRLEIEGREATLGVDAKPALHKAGLVFVGEEFDDLLGKHTYTDAQGQETELVGFSDDHRLFLLYDDFLSACNPPAPRPDAAGKAGTPAPVPYGGFPIPDLD